MASYLALLLLFWCHMAVAKGNLVNFQFLNQVRSPLAQNPPVPPVSFRVRVTVLKMAGDLLHP
jgi:hypothetical protein